MKLGIFLQHYFPYGGLQRDALRLAHAAKEAGDEPIIAVSRWDGPRPDDVKVLILNSGGRSNHQKAKLFARDCQSLYEKEKLDTAICFSRVPGTPFHFCGDSCYKETFTRIKPSYFKLLPRYRYMLDTESSLFGKESNTHIFFLAASELSPYQRFYNIEYDRYTILPPWLKPLSPLSINKTQLKENLTSELNLEPDIKILLFVASNYLLKGLDKAIQALSQIPNEKIHLIVCGNDDASKFDKLAKKNKISHRVHILGPRDDIPAWMTVADILIHPARQEAAGMVLTEALTHGLPIICTENCGYAPYVREASSITLPPDPCISIIAKSITIALKNQNLLSENASRWALDPYRYQTASILLDTIRSKNSKRIT